MPTLREGETVEEYADRSQREMEEMFSYISTLPNGTFNADVYAKYTTHQWLDFQAWLLIGAFNSNLHEQIVCTRISAIIGSEIIRRIDRLEELAGINQGG